MSDNKYDGNGGVFSVTNPLGLPLGAAMGETTTYLHDIQGNLLNVSDPLGDTTTHAYDALAGKSYGLMPSATPRPTAMTPLTT
jgi:hypothetical protein